MNTEDEVWDVDNVAAFLKVARRYLLEKLAPHPDFPKPKRFPCSGIKGERRWKAQEVRDWFDGLPT